jgi:hypothetical protein
MTQVAASTPTGKNVCDVGDVTTTFTCLPTT